MRRYTKDDVDTHSEGFRGGHPAVNVKVRHFVSSYKVMDKFNCTEKTAEKALQFAFDSACERFWNEDAQSLADEIFPYKVKVYSEGRSGGWLVVHGLSSIEDWDCIMLAKWRKFEKAIKNTVEAYTSESAVLEDIEANKWYLDGAQMYNFVEDAKGNVNCIAELWQGVPVN